MRNRPYAFLRIADRWVNMAMVSDIVDEGDRLTLYLVAEAARLAGRTDPTAIDVARQFTVTAPDDVTRLRTWLKLHDED